MPRHPSIIDACLTYNVEHMKKRILLAAAFLTVSTSSFADWFTSSTNSDETYDELSMRILTNSNTMQSGMISFQIAIHKECDSAHLKLMKDDVLLSSTPFQFKYVDNAKRGISYESGTWRGFIQIHRSLLDESMLEIWYNERSEKAYFNFNYLFSKSIKAEQVIGDNGRKSGPGIRSLHLIHQHDASAPA